MKALKINNLTKEYPNKVIALENVSFEVEKGDFYALLGPNGAGKSTLIGIISSLVNKTSGSVEVLNMDIDSQHSEIKKKIGVVGQEVNFNQFEKVHNILLQQAGFFGLPFADVKKNTEFYLKRLDLWDKRNEQGRNLSGGMKRRLMVAKALVNNPELLILDEPTAGVDVNLRQRLWDSIKELNRKGTTILLTTHYLEEAESLCKEVIMIDKGKIIIKGEIKKLLESIDLKSISILIENEIKQLPKDLKKLGVFLKHKKCLTLDYKPSDTSIEKILNIILRNNIKIKDIVTSEPSLEDLFNSLIN